MYEMFYRTHKINKKKLSKELTTEQIETIEKAVNIINDINCEIIEMQDLKLSDMHKLNEIFWQLYHKFNFQQDKEK